MPKRKSKSKTVDTNSQEHAVNQAALEKMAAMAECERLAKLPPHERLLEEAKKRKDVPDSLMRVTFPVLRGIKHANGLILVIADDNAATKQAMREAADILGPAASAEEVLREAEKRKIKTSIMSIRVFKRNLLNTLVLCNGHSEMVGAGRGGGVLKDVYKEGIAAIQEAEKWWASNNRVLTKDIKDFMNGPGLATDQASFSLLLGKDWKTDNTLDDETKKLLGFV